MKPVITLIGRGIRNHDEGLVFVELNNTYIISSTYRDGEEECGMYSLEKWVQQLINSGKMIEEDNVYGWSLGSATLIGKFGFFQDLHHFSAITKGKE